MPINKVGGVRYTNYSKNPKTNRVESNRELTYDVKQTKKKLESIKYLIPDQRIYDFYLNSTSFDLGANISELTMNITQNNTEKSRAGDQIMVNWISMKIGLSVFPGYSAVAGNTSQFLGAYSYVRVILVRDKSSAGVKPNINDLLDSSSVGGTAVGNPFRQRLINNEKRFKILKDKFFTLNPQTQPIKTIKMFKKFKRPQLTTYLDNSGAAAGLGQNQYYLYVISSDALAATNKPLVTVQSRVGFSP